MKGMITMGHSPKGLYREDFEHDACGIGAVVSIDGLKSHSILDRALCIVEKLEHRAGKDADGETGDGVGILTQIPHVFFKKISLGSRNRAWTGTRIRRRNVFLSAGCPEAKSS